MTYQNINSFYNLNIDTYGNNIKNKIIVFNKIICDKKWLSKDYKYFNDNIENIKMCQYLFKLLNKLNMIGIVSDNRKQSIIKEVERCLIYSKNKESIVRLINEVEKDYIKFHNN